MVSQGDEPRGVLEDDAARNGRGVRSGTVTAGETEYMVLLQVLISGIKYILLLLVVKYNSRYQRLC